FRGRAQGLAERGREIAHHADFGQAWSGVPPGFFIIFLAERPRLRRPGQLFRIFGGRAFGGGLLGLPDHAFDLVGPNAGPGHHARRGALARAPVDDGELAGARHAVGGERVARPAQVRGRGLLRDHDAVIIAGGVQGPLDGVLGRVPGAHDEAPSSAVLSIRTPRSRAAGQPWLTGAIWPGWPLPQLNAPASRWVCGPPTASIEPQKSVVVAW